MITVTISTKDGRMLRAQWLRSAAALQCGPFSVYGAIGDTCEQVVSKNMPGAVVLWESK